MSNQLKRVMGIALMLLLAACSANQNIERRPADVAEVFASEYSYRLRPGEPVDIGYLLWYPDVDAVVENDGSVEYPLFIFLHGSGGSGDDVGVFQDAMRRPTPLEANPNQFPYLVLMPQAPTGTDWTDLLPVLDDLLDHVVATYPVDESRIYLTGYSMGGAGVWGWGAYSPERFAALAPIAGYWNIQSATYEELKICAMQDTPVYAFHSKQDTNIPYSFTSGVVNTLEQCGGSGEIEFKSFTGISHYTTLPRAMGTMKLYRWLDDQSLP